MALSRDEINRRANVEKNAFVRSRSDEFGGSAFIGDASDAGPVEVNTEGLERAATSLNAAAGNLNRAATSTRLAPGESEDDKHFQTGGFRSLGHLAYTLVRSDQRRSATDPTAVAARESWLRLAQRVTTRASTGLNEASDSDGGLLLPPTFSNRVWKRSLEYQNLAGRITMIPVAGNTYTQVVDAEVSRAAGLRRGGVKSAWQGEGVQVGSSKPTLASVELKLKKLTAMCYATDEAVEDTEGGLDEWLTDVSASEFAFRCSDAIVNGVGAGIPLGFVGSSCRITVAAVSGQGAGTIVAQNLDAMYARRHAPNERRYVWLYNQEAEEQLQRAGYTTGATGNQPAYLPPGLSGYDYATLKGRELINVEQCPIPGAEGDLVLWDPSQYIGITKARGINKDISIHLRFDYGETVFRFNGRFDFQPTSVAPLTPYKGTLTRSPIVTLSSTRT